LQREHEIPPLHLVQAATAAADREKARLKELSLIHDELTIATIRLPANDRQG
jgi:hypothetical protein